MRSAVYQKEHIDWAFSDEAIKDFSDHAGFYEVWRSWKDTMEYQGREVKPEMRDMATLPDRDKELDKQIAYDVIRDYMVYISTHDKDGNHI